MKVVFHCGYDGKPIEDWYNECLLNNLSEPVIRAAGEPFKTCYDIEWCYHVYNLLDPSRSIANAVVKLSRDRQEGVPQWQSCDCILQLIRDFGLDRIAPSKNAIVAFWTIFPMGTAEFLSDSYVKSGSFMNPHKNVVRVLNNPFFHDTDASDRRLVEIAEDAGVRFALDRAKILPTPETLAKEIALLNHGVSNPEKVDEVATRLTSSIAAIMEDWGLVSQVRRDAE